MKAYFTFLFLLLFVGSSFSQTTKINDPIQNFEKLWSEFDLRYANFELKKVDWDKIYKEYLPQVNETTTNKELFEITCSMLQELNDGHATIYPNFDEDEDIECGPPYSFQLDDEFDTVEKAKLFYEAMTTTFSEKTIKFLSAES